MQIGVFIFATDYSIRADDLAEALEERGFESMFLPEHTHIPASRRSPYPGGGDLPREYWHTYDPFVALSFAARASAKLKLGTGICLIAQRDPIVTAKAVASLDRLSGGRVVLGIGGGWNVEEMENHGARYESRFKLLRERVLAMKSLWRDENSEFHGEFVDFDPVWSYPKPAQAPNPPVILGGESKYTLQRVVEFCEGWFPRARANFDPAEGMAELRKVADAAGRDMSTLEVSVFRAPADKQQLERYAQAGIARAVLALPSADRDTVLKLLDDYVPLLH